MSDKVRCFIAADITDAVKNELEGVLDILKKQGADVKWVDLQNMHLTLKFLGYAGQEELSQVKIFLQGLASSQKPFNSHCAGLGAFPSLEHPRVLWAGIDEGREEFKVLAGLIESGTAALGFEKEERPFSAHLTLGRVRGPKNLKNLCESIKNTSFSSAHKNKIAHVALYKSILSSEGPVYEVIQKFDFAS